MAFTKAVKRKVKLKIAVTGPSGSGKTLSALLIARGIVGPTGRIAVIDTENGSASLYSGDVDIEGRKVQLDFDTCEIENPFTIRKYVGALKEAIDGKYDAVVIDSLTHEWAGSGGLMDQKDELDNRGKGNGFTNWSAITKQHEFFKEALQQSDIHLIATMRSKQDYVLVESNGKQIPKKVGMAPIQRDGMEYEFTLVIDLAMNHTAEVSKDRTNLFDGQIFKPSEETGEKLIKWLDGAVDEARPASYNPPPPVKKAPAPKPTPAPAQAAPTVPADEPRQMEWRAKVNSCKTTKELMSTAHYDRLPADLKTDENRKLFWSTFHNLKKEHPSVPSANAAPAAEELTSERADMIFAAFRDCETMESLDGIMKALKPAEQTQVMGMYESRAQEITGL